MLDRRGRIRLAAVAGTVVIAAAAAGLVLARGPFGLAAPDPSTPVNACPPGASGCPPPTGGTGAIGGPTLRQLADAGRLRLGTAVNTDALVTDPDYAAVLAREFNAVTAEDAMKWGRVEPAQGVYNWAAADLLVEAAERVGQQVYGHALVWHASVPGWIDQATLDRAGATALLREHVTGEVARYKGRIWAWDVVNEPLDGDGRLRDSVWLRTLGPGYIAEALRWARAADPTTRLFINEFNIEGLNAKSDALYALVRALLADGVPLDGVGFQTHWSTGPPPAGYLANLRRFAALGLDVAVTEADVRVALPVTAAKLAAQAEVYAHALTGCLAVPRCVSFTVWGFTDRYSWVPAAAPESGAACLFDTDLRPKPAYDALIAALPRRAAG